MLADTRALLEFGKCFHAKLSVNASCNQAVELQRSRWLKSLTRRACARQQLQLAVNKRTSITNPNRVKLDFKQSLQDSKNSSYRSGAVLFYGNGLFPANIFEPPAPTLCSTLYDLSIDIDSLVSTFRTPKKLLLAQGSTFGRPE